MAAGTAQVSAVGVAPLAGSVDRNFFAICPFGQMHLSLPSRGAWIEISLMAKTAGSSACVAPLAGSVDRNDYNSAIRYNEGVAPLAGSVDRNCPGPDGDRRPAGSLPSRGAWIEIGAHGQPRWKWSRSLPSRGAWIEIIPPRALSSSLPAGRSPRGERG